MRQLSVLLIILFTGLNSFADMTDIGTFQIVEKAVSQIKSQPLRSDKRIRIQKNLKNYYRAYLNNFDIPENIVEMPDQDPVVENWRSMNEFGDYLDRIELAQVDSQNCNHAKQALDKASMGAENTQKQMAMTIVRAICE